MRLRKTRTTTALCCAALVGSALLAGCGSGGDAPSAPVASKTPPPHGYVEGAEETAEQQSRLVLAEAGTGKVEVLDLTTEDVTPLAGVSGPRNLRTDGRFAFLSGTAGTHVLDSGAWTVDHGDHVHYYRAAVRGIGPLTTTEAAHIHSDRTVTAVSSQDGARLYDRTKLEDGAAPRGSALDSTGAGAVVPYQEHLLVAGTGADEGAIEVRDREGARVTVLEEPCDRARGEAVTRRGVVFGCADGALLVSEDKGTFEAAKIPYDAKPPEPERAVDFRHRPGSTTLAALSGDDAVWVLDVTDRSWTRIETGPVVAANTAGEGSPLLALGKDGVLTAYDLTTKKATARKRLLAKAGASAVIEVDSARAYVNDAAARKVHEIDYADRLRVARTFPVGIAPTFMVETGR
ncbi:hypothetical protein [Streptomyces griseus]|uniref:hypothetical protein n=1 Tax=Streptomyces griseus TaxID=1911 RepID=UPI0037B5DBEE